MEVLAAVAISAFALLLVNHLLRIGQNQFLARIMESNRLHTLYRLKASLVQEMGQEIEECESGHLIFKEGRHDLASRLKQRFARIESLQVRCYEVSKDSRKLVIWRTLHQPQLVEYHIVLKLRASADTLRGSFLKGPSPHGFKPGTDGMP